MARRDGIVTPEAVVLQFETAGIASRLLAGLIDLLVQGVVGALLLLAFAFLSGAGVDFGGLGTALVYVFLFLVLFAYPAAFETLWRGRTLGKAALGLRVVTVEGAPARFRHAAIRSILGLVDKWLLTGLIGVLALLFTERNQRLGDLVAGTLVLRERTGAKAPTAVRFSPPPGLEEYVATLDAAGVRDEDYRAVRGFLLRASTLPPAVRHQLASQLAVPLAARLRATPPPGMGPDLFLACVAAAAQARGRAAGPGAAGPTMHSVWDEPTPPSWSEGAGAPGPVGPSATTVAGGFVAPD